MTYKKDVFIPFHLIDGAGISFFGNVFSFAHQVYEQFIINEIEAPWDFWFQNPIWIVPIKNCSAEYFRPLIGGRTCTVILEVAEIRNSSFSLNYQLHQNNTVCCKINTVHVFCDKKTNKKIVIPQDILLKFEAFRAKDEQDPGLS